MKNILVAIDFSPASLNALDYAINLAHLIKANLMLLWVDNLVSEDEFTTSKCQYHHNDAINKLTELRDTLILPRLKDTEVSFKIRSGKIEEEVRNQAKYTDMDYVICGTIGMGKAKEVGTNTFKIVSSISSCPVISVPPSYTWRIKDPNQPAILVLPIDSTPETRQKTDDAIILATVLNIKIHILGLYFTKLSSLRRKVDQYVSQIENYLDKISIPYLTVFKDADNITRTTLAYAKEVDAEIIIIMKEQEIATQNLFIGPYAQQMINTSPIPVMSI
ncbi:MAG: universal stress protein, partial [Bacteroidales bacterium]